MYVRKCGDSKRELNDLWSYFFSFVYVLTNTVYFLQSNQIIKYPYSLIVRVENEVEGNFTLQYEPLHDFKLDRNNSEAVVTVPEVRIHNGFYININIIPTDIHIYKLNRKCG